MPTPAIALPVPDLSGLADDRPWLLLDAAGGGEGMHGFLIAGVRRRMDLHPPDATAYDRITQFIGAASGRCFGWIGYDQLRAHPLLDLPDQPEVAVPLPVAHWVEPEGVLAFQGTGSDAQLDWLVFPKPDLAERMERALRTVRPVADRESGPAVSGESGLDAQRYRTAFDRVRDPIRRGDVAELNLCRKSMAICPKGGVRMSPSTPSPPGPHPVFCPAALRRRHPVRQPRAVPAPGGDQLISRRSRAQPRVTPTRSGTQPLLNRCGPT